MLLSPPMALIISIGGAVDQRDAVPQDVALRRAQKLRALADAERRECDDAKSGWARARASAFMLRLASESSVVQLWPGGGTYCRSSSQIGQAAGGFSLGAYCVPQVVQMKAGMATSLLLARRVCRIPGARQSPSSFRSVPVGPGLPASMVPLRSRAWQGSTGRCGYAARAAAAGAAGCGALCPLPMNSAATAAPRHSAPDSMKAAM